MTDYVEGKMKDVKVLDWNRDDNVAREDEGTSHSGQLMLSSRCFTIQLWRKEQCIISTAIVCCTAHCTALHCKLLYFTQHYTTLHYTTLHYTQSSVVPCPFTLQNVWRHSVTVVASTR